VFFIVCAQKKEGRTALFFGVKRGQGGLYD